MGLIITTTIQGNRMKLRGMIIERFRDNCVSGGFDFF